MATYLFINKNNSIFVIKNMFTEREKSTFKYWFAHWCAYQMTALNLKCWKFKYLFHDIEKPWFKLFLKDYKKVRNWHRLHNKHHLSYKNINKIDWEAVVLDWECSRFTKEDSPKTAREKYDEYLVKFELGQEIGNWQELEKYKNKNGNYDISLTDNIREYVIKYNSLLERDKKLIKLMIKNVPSILDRLGL